MDRTVLQAIFDAVDIHREGRVSRHRLIQALSEDAALHRLLGIAEDQVRAQVRRDFLAAFGFDGGEDAVVTFEQFAAYLERSFQIATRTSPPRPPPPAGLAPMPPAPPPPPPAAPQTAPAFRIGGGPAASPPLMGGQDASPLMAEIRAVGGSPRTAVDMMFDQHDVNRDGVLDREEVRAMLGGGPAQSSMAERLNRGRGGSGGADSGALLAEIRAAGGSPPTRAALDPYAGGGGGDGSALLAEIRAAGGSPRSSGGLAPPAPRGGGTDAGALLAEIRAAGGSPRAQQQLSPGGSASPERERELEQQITRLEARAAQVGGPRRRHAGADLSAEEQELERKISALEREQWRAEHPEGAPYPADELAHASADPDMSSSTYRARLFMERRRAFRQELEDEDDTSDTGASDIVEGSYGPRAGQRGWHNGSMHHGPPASARTERVGGYGSEDEHSLPEEGSPGSRYSGGGRHLLAEVYGPENPNGRSVWKHTPYGKEPPPDDAPRSVRGAGRPAAVASPGGAIADRSRSMLQERRHGARQPGRASFTSASPRRAMSPSRGSQSLGDIRFAPPRTEPPASCC